jgi:hypothetical protein
MKSLAVILIWFAAMLAGNAQGPRMTVAGTPTILAIEEAVVDIRVAGGVARTEMELVFRNDSDRMVEGEFTLPLPAGATVSSYALEVNGALREAVAVEKERARNAYESIKRQMIDPGIVERQAGNVYRTRVFPVPAKGTKRLRIGYVESLARGADGIRYRVPLKFEGLLATFRAEIAVPNDAVLKLSGAAPLTFATDFSKARRTSEGKALRLAGELEIRLPASAGPEILVDGGSQPVFLLNDVFPDLPEEKRPAARTVDLFWDASESVARLDPGPAFKLLDAWFREQGELEVSLKVLRDTLEDGGVHAVRGGDWSALRKVIESVDYEGATSFAGLATKTADLAIYCGDGAASLGTTTGVLRAPLLVIHRGGGEPPAMLDRAVERTTGALVRVDRMETEAALRALRFLPFRVTGVSGEGVEDFQIEPAIPVPGQPLRVSGNLKSGAAGTIEIRYGVGAETRVRRQVAVPVAGADEELVRRIWAQDHLAMLERRPETNRDLIVRHCRRHRLVSDETSLIVLERFEDHLRYEIPPPEPELLAKYEKELKKGSQAERDSRGEAWRRRLAWHRRGYPDREYVLLPRFKQIELWKRAVESVFDPAELDGAAFAKVGGWNERVLALIERRKTLPDAAAYEAWCGEVEALDREGPELFATPVSPPPAGRLLVVSVRGLVVGPGQVKTEGALTLRESLAKAGGPLRDGALGRVALYRSGGKTVFDLRSERFEDFELRPGDMVVVENEWWSGGEDDPFSAWVPEDPRAGEPVVGRQDVWISDATMAGGAADGGAADGGGRRAEAGAIRVVDPAEAETPDLAEFERRLKAGEDPQAAYRAVKGGTLRPARFHIEAARRLFAAGHDVLAARVLSTLAERDGDAGRRAVAMWLMEFRRFEAAEGILSDISHEAGACSPYFLRAELATDRRVKADLLSGTVRLDSSAELFEIVATEANAVPLVDRHFQMKENLPCDLRVTVAGSFADLPPRIEVIEPTGHVTKLWTDSPTGGRVTAAEGLAEFAIRRAVPGMYRLRVSSTVDQTFRVAVHSGWGGMRPETLWMTRLVEAGGEETVAEIDFKFVPATR